jgi:hypothetical protein
MEYDLKHKTDEEIIESMHKYKATCDDHIAHECEWERRKKERELRMLVMTESLTAATDKMLKITKFSLLVAVISAMIALLAVIATLPKG